MLYAQLELSNEILSSGICVYRLNGSYVAPPPPPRLWWVLDVKLAKPKM